MRKLLLSILSLFAFALVANAADIVFNMSDPNAYVAESNKVTYAVVADGASSGSGVSYSNGTVFANGTVKMTISYASGSGVMAFTQTSKVVQLRIYKPTVLTFETTDGSNITKIAVSGSDFTSSKFSADCGTMGSGSWNGSSSKVVLTCKSSTPKINTLTVTTASADVVVAPTFSVAEGTYYEAQTVEIANPHGSGKVYYTTNGDDPTAESTEYTAPIEIAATTTLKAVVVDGDKSSEITSATYTIATPVEVANIAEYLAKEDATVVKFANPVIAVSQNGMYLFVKDDSGVALIYGSVGQTYENGDVIPAGFYGSKTTYKGLTELSTTVGNKVYSTKSFAASTTNNGPVEAENATLTDITSENQLKYFFLKGVTVNNSAGTITDGTNTQKLFSKSGFATIPSDGEYDVYGFVIIDTDVKFAPTEFVSKKTVASVAEFKALGVGGIAKITCPLTVTAVYKTTNNKVNYYVQDEDGDGIVIFGAIADLPEYEKTDIIPAGFTGTYAEYNGLPEIIDCEGLAEATETGTIVTTATTIEEIGTDAICSVVELSGAEILDIDGSNFNIKDESTTVAAYNKFGLERIEAYTGLKIVGIVDVYNGKIQILPIEIDYTNGTAEEAEINADDDIVVSTGEGSIIVDGGDVIQIVTPDGRATTVKGSGDTPDRRRRIIETENGIYIVVVDGEVVEKVYVE